MDTGHAEKDARGVKFGGLPSTHAINKQYAAFVDDQHIWLYDFSDLESEPRQIRHGLRKTPSSPVIALPSVPHSSFGLARGRKTFIFDVRSGAPKVVLRGNGHNVTAISFLPQDQDLVATGTANGSICIWSMKNTLHPLHFFRGIGSACRNLAFSTRDHDLIAAEHSTRLVIWSLQSSKIVSVTDLPKHDIHSLWWSANHNHDLISVTDSGEFTLRRFQDPGEIGTLTAADREHGDTKLEDCMTHSDSQLHSSPVLKFDFGFEILQIQPFGRSGLMVLPAHGRSALFYSTSANAETLVEVWRLEMHSPAHFLSASSQDQEAVIAAYTSTHVQTSKIPPSICDELGYESEPQGLRDSHVRVREFGRGPDRSMAKMLPVPVSCFPKIIPTRKYRRKPSLQRFRHDRTLHDTERRPSATDSRAQIEGPALSSLTSSLELPASHKEDQDSFMPFLSPSIPASKDLPPAIAPLDETLKLPPLASTSFDTNTTDTANDSDSDDDALTGPLTNSGTLLPGGVNVPLPRTCGALFTPSGNLVVFLLSKPRPASAMDELDQVEDNQNENQQLEVTRLFPSFGNLVRLPPTGDVASDSESMVSMDFGFVEPPRLVLQASSFDSRHHWNMKAPLTKPSTALLHDETKLKISVYNVDTLSTLHKTLAEQYRLLCVNDKAHVDLCNSNADKATEAGFSEIADIWTTLSLSLQRESNHSARPRQLEGSELAYLSQQSEPESESVITPFVWKALASDSSLSNKFHSSQPLETTWAIKKLMGWAERRGDIQMLAHICVVVLVASGRSIQGNGDASFMRTASESAGNLVRRHTPHASGDTSVRGAIPVLRANLSGSNHASDLSVNTRASRASSRNASQPSTPYLESALSTPPLLLSTISRQSSRLSAPGSASPEHNRSSFSAAAKYYAQSITDKFSSYGSSPPMKKGTNSPNLELSSSLPTTTGSWSKTVSFASTKNAAGVSVEGLGIVDNDLEYDSDKTIDDGSLPQTSKPSNVGVPIRWHRQCAANDKIPEGPTASVSIEFRAKSRIWCGFYAERLRSWNLMLEASELEKVIGINMKSLSNTRVIEPAVLPCSLADKQHATCTICQCVVRAAEQICPSCQHTTHPTCFENYLESLSTTVLTCPAGCGCDCTLAEDYTFVDNDTQGKFSSIPVVKKRLSFTDPRRARARLEGESW